MDELESLKLEKKVSILEQENSRLRECETTLREIRQKYQAIFDASNDSILEIDERTGAILDVNPAACLLYSYSREEMLGLKLTDLSAEPDKSDIAPKESSKWTPNCFHKKKDGTIFRIQATANHPTPGGRDNIILSIRDISNRLQAETLSEESEERYHSVFFSMNEGVFLNEIIYGACDIPIDYEILDINPAFELLFGIKKEKAVGSKASALYGAGQPPNLDIYAKVAATGEPCVFETYLPPMRKHFAISVFSPGKGNFAAVFHDITDRRKSEEELKESEQKFRFLAEHSIDIIYTVDLNERYMYVSPSVERILGYTVDEALAMNVKDFMTPDSYRRQCDALGRRIRESSNHATVSEIAEFEIVHKNGSILWGEINARFIVDNEGRPCGILGICRDITERKRLEEQVQLHQRMDSLGTLAGGIAHDFNNILVGIMGNIDLLKFDSENFTDKQKGRLDSALRSCDRAADLIRQFQALSRISSSKMESIDLYGIVEEVFGFLDKTTDKIIEKIIDFEPGKYFVYGNESELHQVFLNLGTNAVDAIEERGKKRGDFIKIAAENSDGEHPGRIRLPEGKFVHISVEDNGAGMSEEVIKKAFDPFFTTKEKGTKKGQGLGLAMVYNIVTRIHNGYICIESEAGKGAVFHIYLSKAEMEDKAAKVGKIEPPGGGETVLIIDDEQGILEVAGSILSELGYTVLTATDGEEGLKKYGEYKDSIDIVILDLTMPVLSGEAVLREILDIDPHTKVIISSGHSKESVKAGILAKVQGIVKKPYRVEEFARTVREVLDM